MKKDFKFSMTLRSSCEDPPKSLSRTLEQVKEAIISGGTSGVIYDLNGNSIGEFSVVHEA